MKNIKQPVSVFWFRRDLRLFDNHGFYEALRGPHPVLPLFVFDTDILAALPDKQDRRVAFIHAAVEALEKGFRKHGSSLFVANDTPRKALAAIVRQFDVKAVFANEDYEPYALERDADIKQMLEQEAVPFRLFKDQVIFAKDDVLKSDGKPYTVFTPYARVWKQKYLQQEPVAFPSETFLSNLVKTDPFPHPSLEEIGFKAIDTVPVHFAVNEKTITDYHQTRNLPGVTGTSGVSVYLRFGTVSVRQMAAVANRLNGTWLNELIWREFFMSILFHFPFVVQRSFKAKYEAIEWRNNEEEFRKWCAGETGYPLVDAGMRQLNATGWMHNRVRLVVASFLIKHLLIDWRWGDAYFAGKLLDYELASNNGNWQWAAGSGCDAAPYFRVFNPLSQAEKFDPQSVYIKRWIEGYAPGYLPPIVEHDFARKRALEVYKRSLYGKE